MRGRDSLELDCELVDVYTFRDGLIAKIDGFRDRSEALQAVGLSEQPPQNACERLADC